MKTDKKASITQRKLLNRKLVPWLRLRQERTPPSGWIKAVRGALGVNMRQLAHLLGVEHGSVQMFEKREVQGKITLETLEKVAAAMHCKLIYALVPTEPYSSLDGIVEEKALKAARDLISKVDHSMRLEQQGLTQERSAEQLQELAAELKAKLDPSLWGTPSTIGKKRKQK